MVRYIIIGLVFYLGFLLVNLPANVVYGYWKQSMGEEVPVILDGLNGSVWSGSAAQASIAGQPLEKLKWQFKPMHLLLGNTEVALDFSMQEGYGKGNVGYNVLGSFYADNVEAWLPMGLVLPMFDLGSLKAGGALAVNLSELKVKNHTVATALGSLAWQDAEITILKPMPLGSLKVELEPTDDGIKGVISDMGGPLQAEGLLTVDQEGKYDLSAEIEVRDPQQRDLANAIRSLGRQDRTGKVKIQQAGNLASIGL
ncbi:MAG: type II secretion system protein N [Gammaproteobacteria bacterium]|nr:type II secretion system protein N [Gammaproteobacteria bacterium]